MATPSDTIDLGRMSLSPGEGRRADLDLRDIVLTSGGQHYTAPQPEARLDVSRTIGGYALRLRFTAQVGGPCVRCLEDGEQAIEVDAREVDQSGSGDEELRSPYVEEYELDLAGWARDALVLALPEKFLCRADCAGLCPVCGESLNDADPAEHRHERAPDPRWAKLRELKLD